MVGQERDRPDHQIWRVLNLAPNCWWSPRANRVRESATPSDEPSGSSLGVADCCCSCGIRLLEWRTNSLISRIRIRILEIREFVAPRVEWRTNFECSYAAVFVLFLAEMPQTRSPPTPSRRARRSWSRTNLPRRFKRLVFLLRRINAEGFTVLYRSLYRGASDDLHTGWTLETVAQRRAAAWQSQVGDNRR